MQLCARLVAVALLVLACLTACDAAEPVAPHASVTFVIDAPLCGSHIPVQFFIDSIQVGTDTFIVGLSPEHRTSRPFPVAPGQHTLGAQVVSGLVWPDTIISVAAGDRFVDSLPFYCS